MLLEEAELRNIDWLPTPQELLARRDAIKKGWTEGQRCRRSDGLDTEVESEYHVPLEIETMPSMVTMPRHRGRS